ncbi:PREDICTED: uncharacterized protein C7orf50 homolog [Phaethon lepturus]|nr:PREDICTED: uncharacterized protein C7orf50 homolog [Phaethon lepturus]
MHLSDEVFPGGIQIPNKSFISFALGRERRQGGEGKRSLPLNPHQRLPSAGSEVACHGDLQSLTSGGREKVESKLNAKLNAVRSRCRARLATCLHPVVPLSLEEIELVAKKDEELTAEERRKLERKLKKERKKKEKQLMREAGISIKKVEPKKQSGSELALAYLTSWSENPEEWKFQKTRQTWLLLHMYDKEKVPDKYFNILLDYLQGLQGGARDITVQKAEAFMKEFDGSDAEDPNLLEKCERIRQVLQLLS